MSTSATPERYDDLSLASVFDYLIQGPQPRELLDLGYLCPIACYTPEEALSINNIIVEDEKYNNTILSKAWAKGNGCLNIQAFQAWRRINILDLPTLGFCLGVDHAKSMAKYFSERGVSAAHIDGSMPTDLREDLLDDFKRGRLQVLFSADLLIEGVDLPNAGCALILRATSSRRMWLQMLGRISRRHHNRSVSICLDFGRHIERGLGFPESDREWSLTSNTARLASEEKIVRLADGRLVDANKPERLQVEINPTIRISELIRKENQDDSISVDFMAVAKYIKEQPVISESRLLKFIAEQRLMLTKLECQAIAKVIGKAISWGTAIASRFESDRIDKLERYQLIEYLEAFGTEKAVSISQQLEKEGLSGELPENVVINVKPTGIFAGLPAPKAVEIKKPSDDIDLQKLRRQMLEAVMKAPTGNGKVSTKTAINVANAYCDAAENGDSLVGNDIAKKLGCSISSVTTVLCYLRSLEQFANTMAKIEAPKGNWISYESALEAMKVREDELLGASNAMLQAKGLPVPASEAGECLDKKRLTVLRQKLHSMPPVPYEAPAEAAWLPINGPKDKPNQWALIDKETIPYLIRYSWTGKAYMSIVAPLGQSSIPLTSTIAKFYGKFSDAKLIYSQEEDYRIASMSTKKPNALPYAGISSQRGKYVAGIRFGRVTIALQHQLEITHAAYQYNLLRILRDGASTDISTINLEHEVMNLPLKLRQSLYSDMMAFLKLSASKPTKSSQYAKALLANEAHANLAKLFAEHGTNALPKKASQDEELSTEAWLDELMSA